MKGKFIMKNFIIAFLLMSLALPVFSEEINLTPKNSFSGFNNRGVRPTYPQLHKEPLSAADIVEEQNEQEFIRTKSVKEMGNITPRNNTSTPMTYSQFPQNYDSSNTMMLMQGGMQNMFMGY